ncbi:hypothetical protein SteCoe_16889 [Stentor coeruleus]|uniref:Uncharacterized protein n=1 Tax=Stentor coeruleus TaxID=5963 RepID=A0A1R2C077_9CILI|nr:hypothetical protein SteCoe_16889 [Stentor coeruleus]
MSLEKRKKSNECLQADMCRSLRTISLRAQRIAGLKENDHQSRGSLELTGAKSYANIIKKQRQNQITRSTSGSINRISKITEFNKPLSPMNKKKVLRNNKKLTTCEVKKQEIEKKLSKLKEKEAYLKNLEGKVRNSTRNEANKRREVDILKKASEMIVAEVIAKGIVYDIIWNVIFNGMRMREVNLESRKQACLTALNKMKIFVERLERMKRELEKQALELINQKSCLKKNANFTTIQSNIVVKSTDKIKGYEAVVNCRKKIFEEKRKKNAEKQSPENIIKMNSGKSSRRSSDDSGSFKNRSTMSRDSSRSFLNYK